LKTKRIILFICFPFVFIAAKAQINNVLNYSFEQQFGCGGLGDCSNTGVTNWYQPTINAVNWFSYPCYGSSGSVGVPSNIGGYQFARSGQSYSGVEFSETGHTRTYIVGTFSNNLIATKKYCVAFYVSLGDSTWWAISAIGAYLSNNSIPCNSNSDTVLHYIPQIENPSNNILTDKKDWVPVSGEYTAMGGEKFITIGDFYSDTLSKATYVGDGGTTAGWQSEVQTYYYVDDVYVQELTIAVAGKADTVCKGDSVLIGRDSTTPGVSFHWLPTAGLANPNAAQTMASPEGSVTYTLTVVNDSVHNCNCKDSVTKDSISIHVCTGIDELYAENGNIKVKPNPNDGNFSIAYNLENQNSGRLELYNQVGMKVGEYLLPSPIGSMQINTPNLGQGLYIYKLYAGNEVLKIGKIIIIR